MPTELGIKAGEVWAFKQNDSRPLCRARVIDPGDHYDASIHVMVLEGPLQGLRSFRRVKLPCKWDDVEAYLRSHSHIPGVWVAPEVADADTGGSSLPVTDLALLGEAQMRRIVREELARALERPQKLAYTYEEAAEATGYSQSALRAVVARGELLASYANAKPVFTRTELQRWLDSLPVEPR